MFPIQMTFTVSTPAELAKLVAATGAQVGADVPKSGTNVPKKGTSDPKPEAPAATQNDAAAQGTQAAKTEPASVSPSEGNAGPAAASAAPPADTPATPASTAAASGAIDYDKDVKPVFLKLVQTKGRAAGRKIIDAFAPTKEKLSEAISGQEQLAQALTMIKKELGDA